MAGTDIYVDPAGVLSIVTQMKMTADTLDELQRIITSPVQEVLWNSQALVADVPVVGQFIGQAQEQMSQFVYLGSMIADDLRTSAASLTLIAQKAEDSISRLSQFSLNAYNDVNRHLDILEISEEKVDSLEKLADNTKTIFHAGSLIVDTLIVKDAIKLDELVHAEQLLAEEDQSISEQIDALQAAISEVSVDEPDMAEVLNAFKNMMEDMQSNVEEELNSVSDQIGTLLKQLSELLRIDEGMESVIEKLEKFTRGLMIVGFMLGIALYLLEHKKPDARTIATAILSNVVLFGSSLIPGVCEVEAVIGAVSIGDMLGSGLIKLESGLVHNQAVSAQMQQAAGYLNTASNDLNLSNTANDIGAAITDVGIGLFTGKWGDAGNDGRHILGDAGNLVQGAALTGIGVGSVLVSSEDAYIQNIPFLPSGIKNVANNASGGLLKGLNNASHFVTHVPQEVQQAGHIWNVASSGVTSFAGSLF